MSAESLRNNLRIQEEAKKAAKLQDEAQRKQRMDAERIKEQQVNAANAKAQADWERERQNAISIHGQEVKAHLRVLNEEKFGGKGLVKDSGDGTYTLVTAETSGVTKVTQTWGHGPSGRTTTRVVGTEEYHKIEGIQVTVTPGFEVGELEQRLLDARPKTLVDDRTNQKINDAIVRGMDDYFNS